MNATCSEQLSLLLCPASQSHVFHSRKMQNDLARSLLLEEILIPPNSVFVGHGYLNTLDLDGTRILGISAIFT